MPLSDMPPISSSTAPSTTLYSSISFLTRTFFMRMNSSIDSSSSLLSEENTIDSPAAEEDSLTCRSNVRAEGSAPPTRAKVTEWI